MDSNFFIIGLFIGSALTASLIFATRSWFRTIDSILRVPMGRYLGGFEELTAPVDQLECKIDDVAFVFVTKHDRELARIPRTAVNEVFCDDKKQLFPRLTSNRNLSLQTLGINQAGRKSTSGYCLVIDWDNRGVRQNTIFQFGGISPRADAHRVQTIITSHRKPRQAPLRFDERHCPFCKEVVKKESLLCKHCHSRITEPALTPRF